MCKVSCRNDFTSLMSQFWMPRFLRVQALDPEYTSKATILATP